MSLKSLVATVKEKNEELAALLKAEGEKEIKDALKEVFAEYPALQGIRWQQYTPYFNDGEPCEFSVHEVYYRANGMDEEAGDYEDGYESIPWDKKERNDMHVALAAFSTAIESLDGAMEDVFGDHVQVTCTREKIEIEEYSHD